MAASSEVAEKIGRVQIRDWSLWTKHISGDAALAARLEALPEDALITLIVDGERGEWVKKKNSKTGAPTPGLKPIGPMREIWFDWYKTRRGALLEIECPDGDGRSRTSALPRRALNARLEAASPADQEAAWSAFEALAAAGWRWDGPRSTGRDELHERG